MTASGPRAMPAARKRKLKVFQAPFGFYESVLAVPSKDAALRSWGTRQDLFAEGFAKPATDEDAIKAALAHPGTPLVRAVGSHDPFRVKARGLPKLPSEPKRPTRERPRPDRGRLDAAEAALRRLEDAFHRQDADIASRLEALKRERETLRRTFHEQRAAARADVTVARAAYRKASG